MNVQITPDGVGRYILSCLGGMVWRGHVDLVGELKQATDGQDVRGLIVDLEGLSFIDSGALGAIFTLRRYAKEAGFRLVVSRPTISISRLLNTVNLPALIPVTDSLEKARVVLEAGGGAAS